MIYTTELHQFQIEDYFVLESQKSTYKGPVFAFLMTYKLSLSVKFEITSLAYFSL